ncbi:MAG: RidA family protein [Alphaproteobacteria bacterium]|nr:RidA family protein [Alphaproteobacteria bacterium]
MPVSFNNPHAVHPTGGRYMHAALIEGSGRRLVVSGQVGQTTDGTILPPEAQFAQALTNLRMVLEAHAMSLRNVVKTTAFLTDRAHLPAYRAAREAAFGDHVSASTLLFVAGLADPRYVFEIEAEAAD